MSTLEFIATTLFGIVIGALAVIGKAYLQRKIENEADLEDKESLTKIEETVKQTLRIELANIQLNNQHRFSIASEERNAIVNYNDALHELIDESFNTIYVERYTDDENGIEDLKSKNQAINLKYIISKERLKLFFDDPEFLVTESSINTDVLSIQAYNVSYHVINRGLVLKSTEQSFKQSAEAFQSTQVSILDIRMKMTPNLRNLRNMLNQYIERVYSQQSEKGK